MVTLNGNGLDYRALSTDNKPTEAPTDNEQNEVSPLNRQELLGKMKQSFGNGAENDSAEFIADIFAQGAAISSFYSSVAVKIVEDDIYFEELDEFGLNPSTYFPEAEKLAQFIKLVVTLNLDIICQCEYGQSRSAACAAAILEVYEGNGISIFSDYRYYPNKYIYNKLVTKLKKEN